MSDDKQWEYARIERTMDPEATHPGITIIYTGPTGRGEQHYPSESFDQELALLGRRGWEMVGAVSASQQDSERHVDYMFKRPHDANRRLLS